MNLVPTTKYTPETSTSSRIVVLVFNSACFSSYKPKSKLTISMYGVRVRVWDYDSTSGTLNYASAGAVEREKKEKKEKISHEGDTTGTHSSSNEAIHPSTCSSRAERHTTVTPTKRSTHSPCITAVQQMTYSSMVEVDRER